MNLCLKTLADLGHNTAMNLKDIYLFQCLSKPQLERLSEITVQQEYKKDNFLFLEGEDSDKLHILTDGMIKIYKCDKKGNEIMLNHFYPTTLVAEFACLEHIPYPATAVFETDGRVISVDYTTFEKEFLKNPDISLSIIKSLTHKIKALDNVITRNLTLDSTGRAAKFIYENEALASKLKQNKVAAILNITPETMSRVIRKFRESGIVDFKDGKLRISNKDKLKELFQ